MLLTGCIDCKANYNSKNLFRVLLAKKRNRNGWMLYHISKVMLSTFQQNIGQKSRDWFQQNAFLFLPHSLNVGNSSLLTPKPASVQCSLLPLKLWMDTNEITTPFERQRWKKEKLKKSPMNYKLHGILHYIHTFYKTRNWSHTHWDYRN